MSLSYGFINFYRCFSASFGLAAFLYKSQVQIQLCCNMEHVLMFEKALRGGWSGVSGLRYATANHSFLGAKFEPSLPQRFLLDLDVVALYSYCMTMNFGYKDFTDMDKDSLMKLLTYLQSTKGEDIKTNSEIGFLIECDLEIDPDFLGKLGLGLGTGLWLKTGPKLRNNDGFVFIRYPGNFSSFARKLCGIPFSTVTAYAKSCQWSQH